MTHTGNDEARGDDHIDAPRFVEPVTDAAPVANAAPVADAGPAARSFEVEAARISAQVRRINREVNERSGRNLGSAIGMAVLLGGLLLLSLLIDKRWFVLFATGLVVVLVVELATAMRSSGRHVPRVPSAIVAAVVVPVAFYFGPAWQWAALLAGLAVVVLWRLLEGLVPNSGMTGQSLALDASSSAFVQFYGTFLGSFTAMLAAQPLGEYWVISFIIVVICIDTGAYVFGMRYGRTKLAPRISPGKTWEGIIGGGFTAVVGAVLVCVFILELPWWFGIIMGVAITITSVAGDLTESMVKRDLKIKDMSNWLPGHGGFYDRVDSMLPSGAMAFALYFWSTPLQHLAERLG